MKILIVGASGRTGHWLATYGVTQGHEVTALARRPQDVRLKHVRVLRGNALDPSSVEQAVVGQDAVISVLGTAAHLRHNNMCSAGTRNIVACMQRHGVPRFLCTSIFGVGDSAAHTPWFYRTLISGLVLAAPFDDKERMEAIVSGSTLDWTIVRPGFLTNGAARQAWRTSPLGDGIKPVLSRRDLALFLLDEMARRQFSRRVVTVGS